MRKRKNNGLGNGQVKRRVRCRNNRKSEKGRRKKKRKKSELVIIIRSSWHYLPLLGRTLEALRGGSEGVETAEHEKHSETEEKGSESRRIDMDGYGVGTWV